MREEFDNHWREIIAAVVRDGQENGEFGPTDAADFSVTLSALLDGLAIQIALDDPVVDPLWAFEASMRFAAQSLGFEWKPTATRRAGARVKKGSR